ncbi:pulmonary surfactant-associated protein D-like isoform X1 [Alligator sinensis]|uniref:Pulmonary surfactant-associated protein D-like isoform X1 n=2 Tax=Alligator sinensis TaxID=38654 RepID=A0A3Q0HGH9_ALLSI|nr:pulmonary surfactant-associated protein D-like isoform X1 [Alligator sinensis]
MIIIHLFHKHLERQVLYLERQLRALERSFSKYKKEMDLLKTHISDLQAQLKALKALSNKTQKVLFYPSGMIIGEKIFRTDGSEGNFEVSQAACSRSAGLLASPRNSEENSALQQIAERQNKRPFLGINDRLTEGTFMYLSGEAIRYTNWSTREPNDSGGEKDCVEVYSDGKWNDKSCEKNCLIMCEY